MKAGSSGRHFNALPVLLAGISAYILISGVIYSFKESYSLDNASFLLLNSISEAIAFGGIYLLLKERFPLRFRFSTSAFVYGLASWLVVFVFTQAYFFCVRALGFEPDLYQHEIFKGIDSFAHSAVAFLSVAVLPPFLKSFTFGECSFRISGKSTDFSYQRWPRLLSLESFTERFTSFPSFCSGWYCAILPKKQALSVPRSFHMDLTTQLHFSIIYIFREGD